MHYLVGSFTKWILLMWRNRKSEVERVTKLKQHIASSGMHGVIPLGKLHYVASFSTQLFCITAKLFHHCHSWLTVRISSESTRLATLLNTGQSTPHEFVVKETACMNIKNIMQIKYSTKMNILYNFKMPVTGSFHYNSV